jgi:hypothetical protein
MFYLTGKTNRERLAMNRLLPAFLMAAAMTAGPAVAAQSGDSSNSVSYSIGIVGYVPVVCRAEFSASVVPTNPGATHLGHLEQFCNSPNGYQIFVDSSPELANATLMVGGRKVTLSGSGSTLVTASQGPAITSDNVVLQSHGASGSLSFRIVAL